MSVSLSGCLRRFLEIICAARNCTQRMQLHIMGSHPLCGSIICMSIHCSVCTVVCGPICDFCICIHFQFMGLACRNAFIYQEKNYQPQISVCAHYIRVLVN